MIVEFLNSFSSVDGKHLMRFQSETLVFKFLQHNSVEGARCSVHSERDFQ